MDGRSYATVIEVLVRSLEIAARYNPNVVVHPDLLAGALDGAFRKLTRPEGVSLEVRCLVIRQVHPRSLEPARNQDSAQAAVEGRPQRRHRVLGKRQFTVCTETWRRN